MQVRLPTVVSADCGSVLMEHRVTQLLEDVHRLVEIRPKIAIRYFTVDPLATRIV